MRDYELMLILKENLDEKARKEYLTKLTKIIENGKGKIEEVKELGIKSLAYKIKKEVKGFYFNLFFALTPDKIKEIDQKLRIDESVLRFLLIKLV